MKLNLRSEPVPQTLRCLNCDQHSCPNHSIYITKSIHNSKSLSLFIRVRSEDNMLLSVLTMVHYLLDLSAPHAGGIHGRAAGP